MQKLLNYGAMKLVLKFFLVFLNFFESSHFFNEKQRLKNTETRY